MGRNVVETDKISDKSECIFFQELGPFRQGMGFQSRRLLPERLRVYVAGANGWNLNRCAKVNHSKGTKWIGRPPFSEESFLVWSHTICSPTLLFFAAYIVSDIRNHQSFDSNSNFPVLEESFPLSSLKPALWKTNRLPRSLIPDSLWTQFWKARWVAVSPLEGQNGQSLLSRPLSYLWMKFNRVMDGHWAR